MPITKMTKEQTNQMAQCRASEIERDFPELKNENFSSEEEYRQALLKDYEALRNKEYELTVRNECTKVYNLAKDGRAAGVSENSGVWNGYRRYINASRISASEKERRIQQVKNCAISRAPEMGGICMNNSPKAIGGTFNSCAITAAAITAEVSAQMGYDGKDNLIIAKYRGSSPSLKNNLAAAQGVAQCDSIPKEYKITPKAANISPKKTARKPTLNELIANGTLGPGDAFAVPLGSGATNTSTGYHAMTIAAVEKDENGKVTGYTLQANNNARLSSHSIKESAPFGNKPVYNAAGTSSWMADKIKEETNNLQNLPTAELEAKVAEAKQKTLTCVNELEQTETYTVTKGYAAQIANNYTLELSSKQQQLSQTPIPQNEAAQTTPISAAHEGSGSAQAVPPPEETKSNNSKPEKSPVSYTPEERSAVTAELKTQATAARQTSVTAELKNGQFAIRTDVRDNVKSLETPDTRSVKEAIKEDARAAGQKITSAEQEQDTAKTQDAAKENTTQKPNNTPSKTPQTLSLQQLMRLQNTR